MSNRHLWDRFSPEEQTKLRRVGVLSITLMYYFQHEPPEAPFTADEIYDYWLYDVSPAKAAMLKLIGTPREKLGDMAKQNTLTQLRHVLKVSERRRR